MQSITNKQPGERLHAHDLLNDYKAKINAACPLTLVHHEQDAEGAMLVIHVPSGKVAESEATGKLAERLTKLVSSFPESKVAPAVQGEIDDTQKAVVDAPINRRKPKRTEPANEQASEVSGT